MTLRRLAFALIFCLSLSLSCSREGDKYGDVKVSSNIDAADGLDLEAVGELVKTAKNAKELEAKLNEEGSINNLDLRKEPFAA